MIVADVEFQVFDAFVKEQWESEKHHGVIWNVWILYKNWKFLNVMRFG